jgi:CRISPR/Cas system CSM-associated protein Csm3 (group 7 of RAMP superfamily)
VLKRKLCEAAFHWQLDCAGPLLIADGRYSKEKVEEKEKRKGWYPVKFFINKTGEEEMIQRVRAVNCPPPHNWGFYVPGTSLRGPFRAQAERILRSLISQEKSPGTACDPFEQDKDNQGEPLLGCSTRWERVNGSKGRNPYKEACPACKLFGFAGLASRIYFDDADIGQGYRSVYRDMIGIDRFTGGVFTQSKGDGQGGGGGANMRFHVLENATFTTTITVINFELWQLGLLAYVFRDFEDGLVPIGFGKTKGFGRVKGKVEKITLSYPHTLPGKTLHHLGSILLQKEYGLYGITPEKAGKALGFEFMSPPDDAPGFPLLFSKQEITGKDHIKQFWQKVAPEFNGYLAHLPAAPQGTAAKEVS